MATQIPKTFKGVQLTAYGKPLTVNNEIPMPELKENQVLVKVEASPINPSDVMYINGFYPAGKEPTTVAGLEGSGTVVDAKGEEAKKLIGKRVGFTTSDAVTGGYGQYAVAPYTYTIPLPDTVSFDIGANSFVNPFTVVLMHHLVKRNNAKAVIHTAAASQLGRQMVRFFKSQGVEVIGVVRKQEQVEAFKNAGGKYVVNTQDSDYIEQLTKYATEQSATVAFDAVAGEWTGNVLSAMPNNSSIYVYGGLSGESSGNIGLVDTIFKQKTVAGFWLGVELAKLPLEEQAKIPQQVGSLLESDLTTTISKVFPYEQANEAFEYYQKNMTQGKVLIKHSV